MDWATAWAIFSEKLIWSHCSCISGVPSISHLHAHQRLSWHQSHLLGAMFECQTANFRMQKFRKNTENVELIWGRCYEHNILRFLPIFREKNWHFSKKNVTNIFLQKNSST
jgi:hypothetical protein